MENTGTGRQSQIPNELDALQLCIEQLEKELESLSVILLKVSTQTPTSILTENSKFPTMVLCEYAENINNKAQKIRKLTDIVLQLSSNLEI